MSSNEWNSILLQLTSPEVISEFFSEISEKRGQMLTNFSNIQLMVIKFLNIRPRSETSGILRMESDLDVYLTACFVFQVDPFFLKSGMQIMLKQFKG